MLHEDIGDLKRAIAQLQRRVFDLEQMHQIDTTTPRKARKAKEEKDGHADSRD